MERNADGLQLRPSVGVGVYIIRNDGKILLGKRKSSHGAGEYAAPGGHLEFGETFEEAVQKEVQEETGLRVGKVELFYVDNNLKYVESNSKHYVTLSFKAEYIGGEPQAMEPEKCEGWDWYEVSNPPQPLAEFAERALGHFNNHIDL